MRYSLTFALVISCLVSTSLAGNFLVLTPFGSRSVRAVFNTLCEGLVAAGHSVTFVSSGEPVTHHENLTHLTSPHTALDQLDLFKVRFGLSVFKIWKKAFPEAAKMMYESEEIMTVWKNRESFDAIIVNSAANEMAFPFLLNISAPFITLQPAGLDPLQLAYLGNLISPATLPSIILPYDNDMTLWERLVNTLTLVVLKYSYHRSVGTPLRNSLKSTFPDLPDARSMYPNQALSLFNSHPLVDGAVPLLPLQVEVGCMSCRPAKPIEDKTMEFLSANDSRPIVLFSLGSFQEPARIPQEYVDILFEAFGQLPQYRFVAKLLPGDRTITSNVFTSMWIPQQDVLGLADTRLFVSHCGRQSISQALYHGVPLLGLPIAFDQPRHCKKMEHKLYAVVLQWEDLTASYLAQHIEHMINNTAYRDRVLRVSHSLKGEKETGLERAVRYIEYVVAHGTDLLQYSGRNLSLWQYLLLDVLAIIAAVLAVVAVVSYLLVRRVCRAVWGKLKVD